MRVPTGGVEADVPVLQIADVEYAYGGVQVLFGPSLTLHAAEAVALLGTNGAGKSTLLRVASGLAKPNRGTVHFCGVDVTGARPEHLTKLGLSLVQGGRAVFADMTVKENLDVQAYTICTDKRLLRDRKDSVLSTFPRLGARLNQTAGLLSGGEQQQLALAKALMLEPTVLCVDELSLGLSPLIVGELIEILRSVVARGVALVLVEQSLHVAAELCERAVFLEKGQVRFEGRVDELMERDDIARAVFLGGDL